MVMLRKVIGSFILVLLISLSAKAQQMPYYTQFRSNEYLQNPAISGTKRTIDARLNYRMQWVGYDGAPRTGRQAGRGRASAGLPRVTVPASRARQ